MKHVSRGLLLLVLLGSACGTQRQAAETALSGVQETYAAIQVEATKVAPHQATSIEAAIAAAEDLLKKGDLEASLAATKDLEPRLKELADRLPAMRTELESTWKTLSTSLPQTLALLHREFGRGNRPSAGTRRATFDAARAELTALTTEWQEARSSMEGGALAEAVSKAEDASARAARLATDSHEGS